ncbi:hypothetical protein JI664_04450 [Rhodobacter sp. NTK016B]|uniref:hypothetical protein n=1 Tax=Rhodobacter sp. NTK016B TaxID=2759676 RepID=UPI001A8EC35E|nr:hypothetical protein [Rhodobacter sp. NTK016B]MBN8291207.1 hypothetical protein [Rhodobacter sp. NTK016B]
MLLRVLTTLAALAVLAGCGWWLWAMAGDLPARQRLQALSVTLAPGAPVVLGRDALVQQADGPTGRRHVGLELGADGAIVAYDLDPEHRLGFVTAKGYDDTARLEIPQGASFLALGRAQWALMRDGDSLTMRRGDRVAQLDAGGLALRLGETEARAGTQLFDRLGGLIRSVERRYALGGAVTPAALERAAEAGLIPDSDLPPDAVRLIRESATLTRPARWMVENGRRAARLIIGDAETDIEGRAIPLSDSYGRPLVERLIVGRTHYALEIKGDVLTLRPVERRVWLDPEAVVALPEGAPITRQLSAVTQRLAPERLALSAALLTAIAGLSALASLLTTRAGPGLGLAAAGLAFALLPLPLLPLAGLALAAALVAQGVTALVQPGLTRARRLAGIALALSALALAVAAWQLGATGGGALEHRLAGAGAAMVAPLLMRGLTPMAALFWAWLCAVALPGAVAGTRLALIDGSERWSGLLERHLWALALIGLAGAVTALIAGGVGIPGLRRALLPVAHGQQRWRGRIAAMLVVILLGVTLIGTETGVFGLFQPSELAKSVLVLLVSVTLTADLARRRMLTAAEGALSLGPPVLAVTLALAILIASALNYDMSPILVCAVAILAALCAGSVLHAVQLRRRLHARSLGGLPIPKGRFDPRAGMAALRARAARWIAQRSSLWPLVLLGVVTAALGSVSLWVARHPAFREGADFDLMRYLLTPWLRAQSWYDMALSNPDRMIDFPETGTQLARARDALAAAHCRLDAWLCAAGLPRMPAPQADALLLAVPAIQDDFAAVSLVHAMGYDGAMIYAGAQMALIACALSIGLGALLTRAVFPPAAWLAGGAAIGFAALMAAQIGLAWGNVLGLFPVMGQPMTFASFGASHHLAVALPFAVATLAAASLAARPEDAVQPGRNLLFRQRIR